jgi:succinyl-diaminopimelate desuccinylase
MTKYSIDREDVAKLLGDVVAIPSINPAFQKPDLPAEWFGGEKVARFVADSLKAEGLDEVLPEQPNVDRAR